MPGFDGTGPMGYGPRTGGGFGCCPPVAGSVPAGGYPAYYGVGRGGYPRGGGRGRAWGGGRGRRFNRPWAPFPAAVPNYGPYAGNELSFLQAQAAGMEEELGAIRRRIEELEKSAPAAPAEE